jgi:hypothetical protein
LILPDNAGEMIGKLDQSGVLNVAIFEDAKGGELHFAGPFNRHFRLASSGTVLQGPPTYLLQGHRAKSLTMRLIRVQLEQILVRFTRSPHAGRNSGIPVC